MMKSSNLLAALSLAAIFLVPLATRAAGDGHDHGEAAPATTAEPDPVITASSESFELVGRLKADELSIYIDRADTNAPVLNAQLSVESDSRRATASFHTDHGDYALDDAAMLAHLKGPGVKTLVFTLIAGDETDLLTGELDVHEDAHATDAAHAHSWQEVVVWTVGALAVIAALAFMVRRLNASRSLRAGGAA